MSYEHCDKHDEEATNGCASCAREWVDSLTDSQCVVEAIGAVINDRDLAKRLERLADRLEQEESDAADRSE